MADHSNPRSAKRKKGDLAEFISNSVALRANRGEKRKKLKGLLVSIDGQQPLQPSPMVTQ